MARRPEHKVVPFDAARKARRRGAMRGRELVRFQEVVLLVRAAMEASYEARFALQRMRAKALLAAADAGEPSMDVTALEAAIEAVSLQLTHLGTTADDLEAVMGRMRVEAENAAASHISDADVAAAVTGLLRAQILHQPARALLAQLPPTGDRGR